MNSIDYKKQVLEDCIYNNYVQNTQKIRNGHAAIEQTKYALAKLLKTHSFLGFTRTSNIRHSLQTQFATSTDYMDIILDKFIDTCLSSVDVPPKGQEALYYAIRVTNDNHNKRQVLNALRDVLKNEPSFDRFSRYYRGNKSVNYRTLLYNSLSSDDICNIIVDTFTRLTITEKEKALEKSCQEINDKINKKYANQIENFRVNSHAINMCKRDIENGKQQLFRNVSYSIDNLYASIDVGNVRKNQQDSVLIVTHPDIPDFKMLVVADGCGGMEQGEKVSSFITLNIANWFEGLHPNYFNSEFTELLQEQFNEQISELSSCIYDTYHGKSSSTFVGAIVNDKKTIISNVGDSRAYVYAGGDLHQLTDDDNVAYKLWQAGIIKRKEDIPFHKDSNRITKGMGIFPETTPTSTVIFNSDYDTLLLFSDGITDCLSDQDIKAVTRNTSPEYLASSLIQKAKTTKSVNYNLDPEQYRQIINSGKDNLSTAILDKRSSQEDGR